MALFRPSKANQGIVGILLAMLVTAVPATAGDPTAADRARDPHGDWQHSRSYAQMIEAGARVIEVPEEKTYFAYWLPPHPEKARVVVLVHGTGGNPYEELKDELPTAKKYGYVAIALKWFDPGQRAFFDGEKLYRCIDRALDWLRKSQGNDLSRVAYSGFSRGSAIGFETAWRDRRQHQHFDLFILHSGGIPLDAVVAPRESDRPDPFFADVEAGRLGDRAFAGCAFFLYSGDRDEAWHWCMSEQMQNARDLITRGGGTVLEWIRDPQGGHFGFRQDPQRVEKALKYFFERTPD